MYSTITETSAALRENKKSPEQAHASAALCKKSTLLSIQYFRCILRASSGGRCDSSDVSM